MRPEELPVSECQGSRSINFDLILFVSPVLHRNSTFVPYEWLIASLVLYKNRLTNQAAVSLCAQSARTHGGCVSWPEPAPSAPW